VKKMSQEELKFGYVTYEETYPLVSEFAQKLKDGKLVASQCKKCEKLYLPPRAGCNQCFSSEMVEKEIGNNAVLTAFTVIHFAPESFSDKAPYIAAIGKFEEGVSLLAHLVGVTSMPTVGMKLKLVPQELGKSRIVYKFIKA